MLLLLAAAVILDLKYHKVFHFMILACFLAGMCFGRYEPELLQIAAYAAATLLPLLLLYPLFMIGAIGAGDIKLFMAMGGFFTPREMLFCIAGSFFFGAVIALFLLLYRRCLFRRLSYLLSYLRDTFKQGTFTRYDASPDPEREGSMHFTLPILLSVLAWMGGFY